MEDFYRMLCAKLSALVDGERNPVPNMANAAALLFQKGKAAFFPGILIAADDHGIFVLPKIENAGLFPAPL